MSIIGLVSFEASFPPVLRLNFCVLLVRDELEIDINELACQSALIEVGDWGAFPLTDEIVLRNGSARLILFWLERFWILEVTITWPVLMLTWAEFWLDIFFPVLAPMVVWFVVPP